MGGCTLRIHENPNYTGRNYDFQSSGSSGWISDRDSSGKMIGDCRNTTYLGFEHPGEGGLAWIMGEGDNVPHMHDGNSHGRGKRGGGREQRWYKRGDRLNTIKKIDIPTENINEGRMREDITIYGKRVDHRTNQWGHFPNITKTSDGSFSANDSDQWLTSPDKKGQPCPGGDAYWKGFQKISCVYDVKSGAGLGRIQDLHGEVKDTFSGDPRKAMFENIINKYCDRADRLEDRIKSGGGVNTCRSVSNSKEMAKTYCEKGDKIKTDKLFCTNEESSLGQALYEQLAGKYCQANKSDEWCACYNVMTHGENCANNVDLPGCEDVADQIEMMQEDLSADQMALVKGTEVCWGSCTGSDTDTFIPKEYDKGKVCNRDVSICVSNITAGNLRDSGIKVNQNCGNKGVPDSESSSSGKDGDGDDSALKSSDIKAGVITDTKTAEGIMNRERFYEKSGFQMGGAAAVSSSACMFILVIILVMFM